MSDMVLKSCTKLVSSNCSCILQCSMHEIVYYGNGLSPAGLHVLLVPCSPAALLSMASMTQLLMITKGKWCLTYHLFCWCRLVGCKPVPAGSQPWPAIWGLQAPLVPLPCC